LKDVLSAALQIDNTDHMMNIFGNFDENLKLIEKTFNIKTIVRDREIKMLGSEGDIEMAQKLLTRLSDLARAGELIDLRNVQYMISMMQEEGEENLDDIDDHICTTARGKPIKSKTLGQKKYVQAIKHNTVTLGIGPAGTGKTYIAVAMAVMALKNKDVQRIVLTRPAVEAGEKLGFLPGDLQDKVDPYLRPLYDALYDILGAEVCLKYIEKGIIEIAPLAYMRGRTLDDSFIILDEAQNTTPEQMKMFLTRIGFGSKAVVTGDITQIDLPKDKVSGLKQVINIVENIKGVGIIYLSYMDVIRHELIQRIIRAYDSYEASKGAKRDSKS